MTTRGRTILSLLSESSPRYTTIERIAEETGAGVRTIHRDLEGLERSLRLRGVRLERRRGFGIRLVDPLPENLAKGVIGQRPEGQPDSGQRPLMILLYLIAAGNWAKISEMAGALCVSDTTIAADLTSLDAWLPPEMRIERHKGTGVRLVSDEIPARLLFLSSFPSLVPMYVVNDDEDRELTFEERFLGALGVRDEKERLVGKIDEAERILGYRFSPTYRGYLYAYLFVLFRRMAVRPPLESLPAFRLDVPEAYERAAVAMIAGDLAGTADSARIASAELGLLARVLSSCETASPPMASVTEYLGSAAPDIEAMLEHALSRLEEKERVWLHDDRLLLNYFRMTMSAAARRIDLGVSSWWEFRLRPFPGIEDTPESVVLVTQFLSDLGRLLREPTPSIVRREIHEASLAIGARLEALRSRGSSELKVKILCYEGLGMANFVLALAKEVFPRGTVFSTRWEPDFERTAEAGRYDLVVSTFPLRLRDIPRVAIRGDDSPESIRRLLREAYEALKDGGRRPWSAAGREEKEGGDEAFPEGDDDEGSFSLSTVMSVIEGFFVEKRSPERDLLGQAIAALDRGDCDTGTLRRDFEKRESFGSLVFDDWNVRILHCRTEGVPEPRAGVIQDEECGETVLVLTAPVSARQSQTHALSEIVIALTEYDDFADILAGGTRREIQSRLMTLFGRQPG